MAYADGSNAEPCTTGPHLLWDPNARPWYEEDAPVKKAEAPVKKVEEDADREMTSPEVEKEWSSDWS